MREGAKARERDSGPGSGACREIGLDARAGAHRRTRTGHTRGTFAPRGHHAPPPVNGGQRVRSEPSMPAANSPTTGWATAAVCLRRGGAVGGAHAIHRLRRRSASMAAARARAASRANCATVRPEPRQVRDLFSFAAGLCLDGVNAHAALVWWRAVGRGLGLSARDGRDAQSRLNRQKRVAGRAAISGPSSCSSIRRKGKRVPRKREILV